MHLKVKLFVIEKIVKKKDSFVKKLYFNIETRPHSISTLLIRDKDLLKIVIINHVSTLHLMQMTLVALRSKPLESVYDDGTRQLEISEAP